MRETQKNPGGFVPEMRKDWSFEVEDEEKKMRGKGFLEKVNGYGFL